MARKNEEESPTGTSSTRLIVLRGNSGSGKTSVAAEVCARHGPGISHVSHDILRLMILREREIAGGPSIGLVDAVARYALRHGFHVIIDGILDAAHCGPALAALRHDHRGISRFYYLDVPFEETVRRHSTRPQAGEFGREQMEKWYRQRDLLPGELEQVIPAASSLEDTVHRVIRDADLDAMPRPERNSLPRFNMIRVI